MTLTSFKNFFTMMTLKKRFLNDDNKSLKGSLMPKGSTIMASKHFEKFCSDDTKKFKKVP